MPHPDEHKQVDDEHAGGELRRRLDAVAHRDLAHPVGMQSAV